MELLGLATSLSQRLSGGFNSLIDCMKKLIERLKDLSLEELREKIETHFRDAIAPSSEGRNVKLTVFFNTIEDAENWLSEYNEMLRKELKRI